MLAFFHECSVVTFKLDPNCNLVYKFYKYFVYLFLLLSILLHCQFARPRVLFIFIYVTGSEKKDHFAQEFKIELLVLKGRVALKH